MKKIWFVLFSIIIILSSLFFVGFKNNDEINILHGKVVYVYDGDTIQLKTSDNKEYKIRLSGIDAPEYNQNYGKKSKAYLNSLICDKLVNIEVVGMDKYKRILAIIFHNNEDINYKMIKKDMHGIINIMIVIKYMQKLKWKPKIKNLGCGRMNIQGIFDIVKNIFTKLQYNY